MTDDPQLQRTPRKSALARLGGGIFLTGGCLMWTLVLIPIALPIALIGFVMWIGSMFVPTEPMTCPICALVSSVERHVVVAKCAHCETMLKRLGDQWLRIE